MIVTDRVVIPDTGIPQKIYTSAGASRVIFNASGGGVLLGGPTLSLLNGFRPDAGNFVFEFNNGDEVWAMASSITIVSMFIRT